MNFITLALSSYSTYHPQNFSNEKMLILGFFFIRDFGCGFQSYQNWAIEDATNTTTCSNCTILEKNKGLILLSSMYSERKNPIRLKMTSDQFIQLCDEWEEKVCKYKPKEVIIKYENDRFFIETHN